MQSMFTVILGSSMLLVPAARTQDGKFILGKSSSGRSILYAEPRRSGDEVFSVFSGVREFEAHPPAGQQPGQPAAVPVAVNDSATLLYVRCVPDADMYRFELVDRYGHTCILGCHQFMSYWSSRSIRVVLNNDGQAAIMMTEQSDVKISTLYWFDGSGMHLVEQDQGVTDPAAGLQQFNLAGSGRLEFTVVDPISRRCQLLTRERDGVVRACLDPERLVAAARDVSARRRSLRATLPAMPGLRAPAMPLLLMR